MRHIPARVPVMYLRRNSGGTGRRQPNRSAPRRLAITASPVLARGWRSASTRGNPCEAAGRSRAARAGRGHRKPVRCLTVPLPRGSSLPGRSPARQPRYTAVSSEVDGRYTRGTSVRPGGTAPPRGSGAGPARGRRLVHRRASAGTRQDHRRSMAPGCMGAERSATTRSSPCTRTTTLCPKTARTAPGNPHPPRLPEAAATGPARWRLSPGRSGCWSRDRGRWPCGLGGWRRACRTGWCRWMS